MERRYSLTDSQWERLQDLGLPGSAGHVGRPAKDTRLFVEAVLFRFRAGIAWRDLPARFGNWHRIYVRFHRWSQSGIWQKIFEMLSKDKSNEYAMIDSTTVRAHRSSAGARKKGAIPTRQESGKASVEAEAEQTKQVLSLTTKVHALCDAQGKPTALCLTGGNSHDLSGFDTLHKQITAPILMADRGYDADKRVREVLSKANKEAVIPPRKNRKEPAEYDKEMYKKRHKIENWFSRLKDYRGIATRFDKLAMNFLSGVYLAAAFTWII